MTSHIAGILNQVSAHTAIAILVGVLVLFGAAIGIVLGEQRRHRDAEAATAKKLAEHEQRLRAQGTLLAAVAEDYDPPPEQRRRRTLPEGWRIYNGGAAILLLTALGAWLRGHWRTIAPAALASGAAAITATAILSHTAPTIHHPLTAPTGAPAQTSAAPHTMRPTPAPKPTPTTKPGHTPPRTMPPAFFVPVRRRAPSQSPEPPTMLPLTPQPPLPLPLPSPSVLTTLGRSPTAACTPGITVHLPPIGVTVCP